jgi:hypothetical protein
MDNPRFARICALICFLLAGRASAQAPSLNPLPTPNLDLLAPGSVEEIERLPDGKFMIAGKFDRVGNHISRNLARLNANGSVDTSYAASNFTGVQQLRTDPSGRTYALIAGSLRRYTASGALDASFATVSLNADAARTLSLVSDGVIVGGGFTTVTSGNVFQRAGLVKIRIDGSVDPEFNVTAGFVRTLITTGFNEVLVAGGFTTIGGVARTGLAKLNTQGAGSVVSNWNPSLSLASGNAEVRDALTSAGSVFIAGNFDAIAGTPRAKLAKLSLSPGAGLDSAWNVSLTSAVGVRLAQVGSTLIVSASDLAVYANPPADALPGRRLMRAAMAGAGTIDAGFNPLINDANSRAAFPVASGTIPDRILVGGAFFGIVDTNRFAPTQLNFDGSVDAVNAFDEALLLGGVRQLIVDPNTQRTYVGGDFLRAGNDVMRHCLRLNPDGSLDRLWRAQNTAANRFPKIALVPGSGLWLSSAVGIVRLSLASGAQIPTWVNSNIDIRDLTASSTAIYASTNTPDRLVRLPLASNGVPDPAFVPAPNSLVFQMQFDAVENTLLVLGEFSEIGGGARPLIARINANTGSLISSFSPIFALSPARGGPSRLGIFSIDLDGVGAVWVSGDFDSVNGIARQSPVRVLLNSGALDTGAFAFTESVFSNSIGFSNGFLYGRPPNGFDSTEIRRVSVSGLDPHWRAVGSNTIRRSIEDISVTAFKGQQVLLGGSFNRIGSSARVALASVIENDMVFRNGFEN